MSKAATWKPEEPAGVSDCHREGISGNCGLQCPVLLRFECDCDDPDFFQALERETGVDYTPKARGQ